MNTSKCLAINKSSNQFYILRYNFFDSDVTNLTIRNYAYDQIVNDASFISSTILNNKLNTTVLDKKEGLFINKSIPCYSTNVISISFWFYSTQLSSVYYFLFTLQDALGYPSGSRFYISITPQSQFSINGQLISQQTIIINKWYHIVIVLNNRNEVKLYINNTLGKGTATFPSFINVAGRNRIGNDPVGLGLVGMISKFQLIFNYTSKEDVSSMYAAGP